MPALHISATDGAGGASRAARRIHEGLKRIGVDSAMAVGKITRGGPDIHALNELGPLSGRVETLLPKVFRWTGELALPLPSSRLLERHPAYRRADVIHLHNLHGNYVDPHVLPRYGAERHLVWTLHDMWALTGHCVYSFGCERWRTGCGNCPLYRPEGRHLDEIPHSPWGDDTARRWRNKRATYERTPIAVAAPSRWLLDLARQSILAANPASSFHHIPYGLDTETYSPGDAGAAREKLGLEPSRPVVLFAAAVLSHVRKGIATLLEALGLPPLDGVDAQLLCFGAAHDLEAELPGLRSLGTISDDRLQAVAYRAADLVVVPSLADNQPLVALEALACGTPVVATDAGGLPEIVRDGESGLCVPPEDAPALAAAIGRLLEERELRSRLGEGARRLALAEHGLEQRAAAYRDLYASLPPTPATPRRLTARS